MPRVTADRPLLTALLSLILALILSGCTAITLVPPYDEQIDTGLTELYGETSAFVDRMVALRGTPDGTHAANQDFYAEAGARAEALIVRAEAHRVLDNCPSAKIVDRALSVARIPADVRGEIGTLGGDDCQVILMRMIREAYREMEDIHRVQGAAGMGSDARGQFIDGGVGARLRAAITVEIAKRSN
jgi:hypothetical protein